MARKFFIDANTPTNKIYLYGNNTLSEAYDTLLFDKILGIDNIPIYANHCARRMIYHGNNPPEQKVICIIC